MKSFTIRAQLSSPIILRGQSTLDALLMAVLGKGDVSNLLKCVDELYYASAAMSGELGLFQKASFVASMRPERTPEWRDVIKPNTQTEGLPVGEERMNDLKIGVARQRTAGNILNSYSAIYSPVVDWHAVGDAEGVLQCLTDVPFIGKKRTSGFGEVKSWEIFESDLDGIAGYANEPLRPIPVERWEYGGDWVPVEAAWKAPYWEVRNRTKCFVRVVL